MDLEKKLREFTDRAQRALGPELDAIVLYGSAARQEFDEGFSGIDLVVLATRLDRDVLNRAAALLLWWTGEGNAQPLLFTREEFRSATDAFPMEILDIQAAHRVLYGEDPMPGLVVDPAHHRLQLEHEARSSLLRLRMKSLPLLRRQKELLRLLEESVTTFLLFARHWLILKGLEAPLVRRELLEVVEREKLIETQAFAQLVDLREGKVSPRAVDPVQLFEDYLIQIERLVASIDAH